MQTICRSCGSVVSERAAVCPRCRARTPRAARLESQKKFWERLRAGGHVLLVIGVVAGALTTAQGFTDLDSIGSAVLATGVLLAGAGRVGSWWAGRGLSGVEPAEETSPADG